MASDEKQVGEEQARRRQSIGANIRNARATAGLSQRRSAKRAGISDGYLSDVGLGRPAVTSDFLVRAAYYLGLSVESFWHAESVISAERLTINRKPLGGSKSLGAICRQHTGRTR